MSSVETSTGLPQRARKGEDPAELPEAFGPLAPIWSPRTPAARPATTAAGTNDGPALLPRRPSQGPAGLPEGFGPLTPLGLPNRRPAPPRMPAADPADRPEGLPRRSRPGDDAVALPEAFRPLTPAPPSERPSRPAPPVPSDSSRPRPRPSGAVPRSRRAASAPTRSAPAQAAATLWSPAPEPTTVPSVPDASPVVAPGMVRPTRTVLVGAVVCALIILGVVTVLLQGDGADPRGDEGLSAQTDREGPSTSDYEPPVTLSRDTEYVETDVLEGGELLVTHWISTSVPMNQLELNVPTSQGLDDPMIAVNRLVVAADGVQVDLASTVVSGADGAGALPAASNLYVQYELSGVMQRSGSAEGRALATVTSLNVAVGSRALARTQTFPGARVLTLACLAPGARSIPETCGRFEEGTWKVVSDADDVPDTVIAQFDLTVER